MSTYAVSFDLKYDTPENYGKRYTSFMAAIRACSTVWEETTSFAVVSTTETLEAFERRLYLTLFDASQDKMLVIDVSYDSAISRGKIADKAKLTKLLPGIVHR